MNLKASPPENTLQLPRAAGAKGPSGDADREHGRVQPLCRSGHSIILASTNPVNDICIEHLDRHEHDHDCTVGPAQPDCGVGKVSYLPHTQ